MTELLCAVGYLLPGETVDGVLEALLSNGSDSVDPKSSTQHPGAEPAAGVWNTSSAAWRRPGSSSTCPR